ncbi:hypothetical protein M885DRAFT_616542 [Pelagophyceae sp. CCMP2097]|nr:hypothetical protein M885DRAFT_616542 [Pelagophyceae sp. CCMP2097]
MSSAAQRQKAHRRVAQAMRAMEETDSMLAAAECRSLKRCEQYAALLGAKSDNAAAFDDLADASAKCSAAYLAELAQADTQHAMLRADVFLSTNRLTRSTESLPWLQASRAACDVALKLGHNAATKWRARFREHVLTFESVVKRECSLEDTSDLIIGLKHLARDVNACGARAVVERLKALDARAVELAAESDDGLQRLRTDRLEAFVKFEASKAVQDRHRVSSAVDFSLKDALLEKQEAYEASAARVLAADADWAKVTTKKPMAAKVEDRIALELPDLRQCESVPAIHGYMAASPDVSTALKGLCKLRQRGDAPSDRTWRLLLRACRKSRDATGALCILDDIARSDAKHVSYYNTAIDVCASSDAWRRALSLFQRMQKDGVHPNTHTYSLLLSVAANSPTADTVEVYEGLKFAGVPEYLAYTAAAAHALNWRPDFLRSPRPSALAHPHFARTAPLKADRPGGALRGGVGAPYGAPQPGAAHLLETMFATRTTVRQTRRQPQSSPA